MDLFGVETVKRNPVIGQTGSVDLSDASLHRAMSRGRTARYSYIVLSYPNGRKHYLASVNGPFHSRTYGATGFGTDKVSAKEALQRRLANDYRYFGGLRLSAQDTSDSVGIVNPRLLDDQPCSDKDQDALVKAALGIE